MFSRCIPPLRELQKGKKNGVSFVPIVTLCPSRFSTSLIISHLQKPTPLRRQFQRVEKGQPRHQKHPKERVKTPPATHQIAPKNAFLPLKMAVLGKQAQYYWHFLQFFFPFLFPFLI